MMIKQPSPTLTFSGENQNGRMATPSHVRPRARLHLSSVIPVDLAELASEAGFHSALLVVSGLLSAHLIPIGVVPIFSHSSDSSWLSASYCSPPSRTVHDSLLLTDSQKGYVWFCFDMNKLFHATWGEPPTASGLIVYMKNTTINHSSYFNS